MSRRTDAAIYILLFKVRAPANALGRGSMITCTDRDITTSSDTARAVLYLRLDCRRQLLRIPHQHQPGETQAHNRHACRSALLHSVWRAGLKAALPVLIAV